MKMKSERKASLLAIRENIEMELFSSEELCVVMPTQEMKKEYNFHQVNRHLEHPLVPDSDEEVEPQIQTHPRQRTEPKTEPPVQRETKHWPTVQESMEEIEIEMEVLPRLRVFQLSRDRVSRIKWRRVTPQKTGLVVKDVVCLPREQLERHIVPRGKERAALAATGMTARITVDYSWSANQMQSRLAMLFLGRLVKRAGQRVSFTYLQCLQGSRVLFVPDTPAEGWTGEQVLSICGQGALYILCQQDDPQAESEGSTSETSAANKNDIRLEAGTETCQPGGQTQPHE